MLDIENQTKWAAGLYPGYDREGKFQLTMVFKAGFSFDVNGVLAAIPEAAQIEAVDRYRGDPGKSSLASACETVSFKKGGELLLSGTAHPPAQRRTVMEVAVSLRRADDQVWQKSLHVFGPRRWQRRFMAATPGDAGPLEPLPLLYEHAFGGCSPGNPEKIFPLNPVGRGYSETAWRCGQLELPQIEKGPKFITAPGQKVDPAGFGPIAPIWEPRLSLFESVDEQAADWGGSPFGTRAPADIWNAAPCDQRFPRPFSGGEMLHFQGLVKGAPCEGIAISLPVLRPQLHLVDEGRVQLLQPQCDTLLIDTDRQVIELVWRIGIPWRLTAPRKGWVVLKDLDLEERGES